MLDAQIEELKQEDPKGLFVIKKVIDEIHSLSNLNREFYLSIVKNVIIDISQAVSEEYSADVSKFKVLTSKIGIIIESFAYTSDYKSTDDCDPKNTYYLKVFSDNKIDNLEQLNINDMLGLFDVDLINYPYLSKCTFRFNRLYNSDQMSMIPSIWYTYNIK